jgi:hypothetical protein
MNIRGADLKGDTLTTYGTTLTANLTNHATAKVNLWLGNVGTFNLFQNSTLDLSLISGHHVGINTATVNITGTDNFTLHNTDSQVAINLAQGARWNGTVGLGEWFGVLFGTTTVNGQTGAMWNNNGSSVIYNTENIVVRTDVVGTGSFDVANIGLRGGSVPQPNSIARLEFINGVGANQVITDSGILIIDRPDQFAAHIVLAMQGDPTSSATPLFPAEIDLDGMAQADSYTFQNDLLQLHAGNVVIEQLHLTDATPHGFAVQKGDFGHLSIVAITDTTNPPVGLPLHLA